MLYFKKETQNQPLLDCEKRARKESAEDLVIWEPDNFCNQA